MKRRSGIESYGSRIAGGRSTISNSKLSLCARQKRSGRCNFKVSGVRSSTCPSPVPSPKALLMPRRSVAATAPKDLGFDRAFSLVTDNDRSAFTEINRSDLKYFTG
jgi:hypothetical protein